MKTELDSSMTDRLVHERSLTDPIPVEFADKKKMVGRLVEEDQ